MNYYLSGSLLALLILYPLTGFAINGMNLEAIGPESLALGGAAMAYDTGSAAVMNNPATIGLKAEGHQVELLLGLVSPRITVSDGSQEAHSKADSFYTPGFGWLSRKADLSYGVGAYAQGGIGAAYGTNDWVAQGTGLVERSEITVGRFVIPVSYAINGDLLLGGSLDFVWAGMDLQMVTSGGQFMDMMPNTLNPGATRSAGAVSGSLVDGTAVMMQLGSIDGINYSYVDFYDRSEFSGAASGTGFGAKLGAVYRLMPGLSLGMTYHSQVELGTLYTDAARFTMNVGMDSGVLAGGGQSGTFVNTDVTLQGVMSIRNFRWPAMFALGSAYQISDSMLLVTDVKHIQWSHAMDKLTMEFEADDTEVNRQFRGTAMRTDLWQRWHDQTVLALGTAYQLRSDLALRAGYNHATNPVPATYSNVLFPGIIQTHYTLGLGVDVVASTHVDFAMSYAPVANSTNNNSMSGSRSSVRQLHWQVGYVFRY